MDGGQLHVVTGAFGYTGGFIARRLLDIGHPVNTLTGHPRESHPLAGRVSTAPYSFDDPDKLVESLRGVAALYNTYWIRFAYGGMTYDRAVQNSEILFDAAKKAGVRRLVHISVTNPSEDSELPYFRGKALVEKAVIRSGLSYAIVRPTLIFGQGDILINNVAYLLRRYPVFAIPGGGEYRLQPVFAEDLAALVADAGQKSEDMVIDAVGPETYTFDGLVRGIAEAIDSRATIVHAPPGLALVLARVAGWLVRDVLLTRDELDGLMADLLVSDDPPTGTKHLSQWLREHADTVGTGYASELDRHYR